MSLPPEVAAEVSRRRAGLLERARGRVLDLDQPDDRARLEVVASSPAPVDPADRFDTIVCTCALVEQPDLARAVHALARLLDDAGELLLIEPVNHAGMTGLLLSSIGSRLRAVDGLHLSRDVVATVRAAGLTVADLDRFVMPTAVWPLRRFVELRAIRIPRLAVPDAAVEGEVP
jgi:SAM-dependent methyltransferase